MKKIEEERNAEMWEIANNEINRLTKELSELKRHLKEIEWSGSYDEERCPACGRINKTHADTCWMAAALKEE